MAVTRPSPAELPDQYDELVAIERLVHGEHNPRRVSPSSALRRSIERDGIQQALIVRPDGERDVYHVTDGWQRYQAATNLGWEQLPVRVYGSPLDALAATEASSIVREWSTYDWAQYCQSLAEELQEGGESRRQLTQAVAEQTVRSPQTVRRYLEALSLPGVVHPLLQDGPAGTEQDWQALQHYNSDVRRYNGLSWRVGARLGRRGQDSAVPSSRVVATAANAVEYETEDALAFIDEATENPTLPLRAVHRRIQQGSRYDDHLQLPSVAIAMEAAKREAVMSYCAERRQPLSAVVEAQIRQLATELVER